MVMLPLLAPAQDVGLDWKVAVMPAPAPTVTWRVRWQPEASAMVTLWVPCTRFVKTLLLCQGPEFSWYWNGAVPFWGVRVMVPLAEPGQAAGVLAEATFNVVLFATVTCKVCVQPLASVKTTE